MPVLLKKKGIIMTFLVDLLLVSWQSGFFQLGPLSLGFWIITVDPAFITGPQTQVLLDGSSTISLLLPMCLSFSSSLCTLGTNFAHVQIFMNILHTVTTPTPNCMFIVFIDTMVFIQKIFHHQLYCSDVLLPSTSLTSSLPSCTSKKKKKTDAWLIQVDPKVI